MYQQAVATSNCGVFLSGPRMGSPNKAEATMPPANTTNIVESQQARGCFLRKNSFITMMHKCSRHPRFSPRKGMCARSEIFLHRQSRQQWMRNIKVREHFQLNHLISDVEKAFGIHLGCYFSSRRRNNRKISYTGWKCGKSKNRFS